jgi:hypothetical protein
MGLSGWRRPMRAESAAPHEIVVEIDRLVLDRFASIDHATIRQAIETELADRLATLTGAEWGRGFDVDRLDAATSLELRVRGQPWTVGSGIAGVVHGAITSALDGGSRGAGRGRSGPDPNT